MKPKQNSKLPRGNSKKYPRLKKLYINIKLCSDNLEYIQSNWGSILILKLHDWMQSFMPNEALQCVNLRPNLGMKWSLKSFHMLQKWNSNKCPRLQTLYININLCIKEKIKFWMYIFKFEASQLNIKFYVSKILPWASNLMHFKALIIYELSSM